MIFVLSFLVVVVVASRSGPVGGPTTVGRPHFLHTPASDTGVTRPYFLSAGFGVRNSIIRSFVLEHPTWTATQVFAAVTPLIAAAGGREIGFDGLRHKMMQIRREMNLSIRKVRMSPDQIAFLKEQFAWEPNQSPSAAHRLLHEVWGEDETPSVRTVQGWWRATKLAANPPQLTTP